MATGVGNIKPPINSVQVMRQNKLAQQAQSGAIIPFYRLFTAGGRGTPPPPQAWLTRR